MTDAINNPQHYTSHPSGIEAIEVTRHMNFNLGNAMKYIWRAGQKDDAIQDLEKAMFYLADEIRRLGGTPTRIEKHKVLGYIRELAGHDEHLYVDDLADYIKSDLELWK
jgi:hypothetical protein